MSHTDNPRQSHARRAVDCRLIEQCGELTEGAGIRDATIARLETQTAHSSATATPISTQDTPVTPVKRRLR